MTFRKFHARMRQSIMPEISRQYQMLGPRAGHRLMHCATLQAATLSLMMMWTDLYRASAALRSLQEEFVQLQFAQKITHALFV